MRSILLIASAALVATPVVAQKVTAPSNVNGAAATILHSAGSAAAAVPAAHEVPAQVVGPTTPNLRPIASGVTNGTTAISNGITQSGDSVAKDGISVHPTNSIGGKHQEYQVRAAQRAADQAKKAVPGKEKLECDAQELALGECQ